MNAIDGYTRAALSLRELSVDEQMWILEQLEEQDRTRITAALRVLVDSEVAEATPAKQPEPTVVAKMTSAGDAAVIEDADLDDLSAVLDGQPEWVTAVIVANCAKSKVVQRYIGTLAIDQIERLRVAAKHARDAIKPKVTALVLNRVAERLKQQQATQSQLMDFDGVLERMAKQGRAEQAA